MSSFDIQGKTITSRLINLIQRQCNHCQSVFISRCFLTPTGEHFYTYYTFYTYEINTSLGCSTT